MMRRGGGKKTIQDYIDESWYDEETGCINNPYSNAPRRCYKLRHGDLPSHLYVCHHCDNPRCIRDDHHFIGTARDNMRDASRKGRLNVSRGVGHTVSEESRKKTGAGNHISLAGRVLTTEHRENISKARRGVVLTDEHRKNMSIAQKMRFQKGK